MRLVLLSQYPWRPPPPKAVTSFMDDPIYSKPLRWRWDQNTHTPLAWEIRGQFHQSSTCSFYVCKLRIKLFCAYVLGLYFTGARLLAQKLGVECWWNWAQLFWFFFFNIYFVLTSWRPWRYFLGLDTFPRFGKLLERPPDQIFPERDRFHLARHY